MRIGVDFDDVLYPYHRYLKVRLQRRFGVDLTTRKVTTFYYDLLPDFAAKGITRDQVWEEVRATWREAADHDEAPLLDDEAVAVLRKLGRAHRVTLVTARHAIARPHVEAFLARHGITPHEVLFDRYVKSGFDVLVDDFPKHAVENAEGGGHSLLYTIDENSTWDETRHPRIRRVHSWAEVLEAVGWIQKGRPSIA